MKTSSDSLSRLSLRETDDRISSLPDSLLLHILSFLDMKNAVLTGILSSRWRDLWTSIPTLDFHKSYDVEEDYDDEEEEEDDDDDDDDDEDDNDDEDSDFINFVERSLLLYVGSNIQKFRLCFRYNEGRYASRVDAWIRFAVKRDVQELDLDFFEDDYYKLPSYLFKCDKLISLKLKRCRVEFPNFVCFSSLVSLSLSDTHFTDCMIQELLAGCPLLEDLIMIRCFFNFGDALSISSSSLRLKRLTIDACRNFGLQVQAPNLQVLKVSGSIIGDHSFKDMSSLSEAYLDLIYFQRGKNFGFPKLSLIDLCHAKVLNLSSTCIQVMPIPTFRNLHTDIFKAKCLTIQTGLQKYELPGIANLLWSSTDLETLIINLAPTLSIHLENESMVKYDFDEGVYWDSLSDSFPCLVNCLKTIKITGFMGRERESLSENSNDKVTSFLKKQEKKIKFVSFLLENAMALEKMTIHVSDIPNFVKVEEWPKITLTVAQKVMAIPRACSSAKVLFISK